jgi:hypothetical protein
MKQTEVNPWDSSPRSTRPAPSSRARSATSPTTARSSRSRRASTACCTSATCRGPRRSATPTRSQEGRQDPCVVLSVDQEKQRIALGVKQLTEDPWVDAIPTRFQPGMVVRQGHQDHQLRRLRRARRRSRRACCTSRSWPTTRSRTRRTWSRSACADSSQRAIAREDRPEKRSRRKSEMHARRQGMRGSG